MTHWWVPLRSFSALSDKRFWQKNVIFPPLLILIFFRDQKFSEAQIRKVSLPNFSALWDKFFDTKSWHNSPRPKIFRNPKLMTHWWVPLRSFSALWHKIFDTKSWHNSLKPKIFRNPKLMTHCWVPLRSFSALSDKKFWQKIVIFPPPPLILIFFRDQKVSEAQIRKVSLRNFSALWDKIFDTKSWHNSLKPKIFRNPKLITHWWVPLLNFSALSDKKFWQKNVIFPPPPLILIFFRDQKFSEAQIRKVSLRNFSALWDKIFDTKSWHNSLKPKIFRNPKLMTHWWVPLRSFSALSDKRFWQKNVIFPPLLILIFFRDQKFSEAQIRKVSLRNFSALWDKIFCTKSWHNSLKPKIFRNPKLMTHWWVPLRSFSALSDKRFWQKIVIFPPLLILIFFRDQKFSEAQIRKVSLPNFSVLWDKIFDTKSWHNSLKPKIFRNPKLMTHWWVPLRSFSALWDKIFDTKSWHNSLKPKIFWNPKLMTHWWVPLRSFSALSDKKFWQISWYFPPLLSLSFFRDQKFSEAQIRKVSLRNYSALWDKIFDTKSWHNSLKPKIFRNPKLMTHWWVPLRSFSALWDKKFWQQIVMFPPSYPYLFLRPEIFRSTDQKGFSTKFFGTVRQNFRHKIVT